MPNPLLSPIGVKRFVLEKVFTYFTVTDHLLRLPWHQRFSDKNYKLDGNA
jgi:hypothetical protein